MQSLSSVALTDIQIDQLEDFLDSIGEAMSLEELDGCSIRNKGCAGMQKCGGVTTLRPRLCSTNQGSTFLLPAKEAKNISRLMPALDRSSSATWIFRVNSLCLQLDLFGWVHDCMEALHGIRSTVFDWPVICLQLPDDVREL
jgi:hypothetical protein